MHIKILSEILNDIFLVIMDKFSDIFKTNIKEYVRTSFLTNNHYNKVKEGKEFMNANNAS